MINYCIQYVSKLKKQMMLYLLLSIVTTIITIMTPIFWGRIIDIMIIESNIELLIKMGILVSVLNLCKIGMNYFNNKLYIIIQTNTAMEISADVIHHLHKISLTKFQEYDAGYLNESINHDSNSIVIFFLSVIVGVLSNGILLIIPLVILYDMQNEIAFMLLVILGVYILLYFIFRERMTEKARVFREAQSVFFANLLEQFKNVKFVKQHALEGVYKNKFVKDFQKFFGKALSTQQFFFLYSSLEQILETVVNFCIYIFGGILVINGEMTIGSFTLILNYYRSMVSSVKYFSDLGKEYHNNIVSYQRLKSYFDLKEQNNGKRYIGKIERIECKNLRFIYGNKLILRYFNYVFNRGHIYCIRGGNGVGKTTLIDILIGLFIDEYKGKILYNGIDIKNIDMIKERFYNISVLEQSPYILEGSVEENIYLTENHCKKEYRNAILNKKLGSIYDDGNGVSGGEKQKIGLQRMLAKNSDVMILDEPTSALDYKSRKKVLELLKGIKTEKIIIIISHDEEVTKSADYIIDLGD